MEHGDKALPLSMGLPTHMQAAWMLDKEKENSVEYVTAPPTSMMLTLTTSLVRQGWCILSWAISSLRQIFHSRSKDWLHVDECQCLNLGNTMRVRERINV